MKLQAHDKVHEIISLNNLAVRNASIFDDRVHLELSPSTPEVVKYLSHINKLDASGCFSIDVPVDMFERLVGAEEMGTRDHKLAQLPSNFIDLRVKLNNDNDLEFVDGAHDASHVLASDEKSGFKPTPAFVRGYKGLTKLLARAQVFSGIQSFFKNGNGALVPADATQPLAGYQRNLVQILTPYSKHFCDDPSKVRELKVSKVEGRYLGVEQRMNSIMEIVDLEESFAGRNAASPLYGKVTLPDVLGNPQDQTWEVESRRHLDSTLRNSRLTYAVSSMDDHIKSKLIPNISEHMSKALSRQLNPAQKAEVSAEFSRFMANIVDASQKRLEPLRKFERMMGHTNEVSPELGLAVLNHLADLNRMKTPIEYQLSDGTKLDFSSALNKLFADPRTFGAPIDNDPKLIKQAANSVLLNYVSRELSSTYWGITAPTLGMDSIDAILNVNKFKASEHFSVGQTKVADVEAFFDSFSEARNLLVNQVEEYSGYALDKSMVTPPKQLLHKFLERSAGNADVTHSRGLLLRTACELFKAAPVPDDKIEALLREGDMLSGKPPGTFAEGVKHVTQAYNKTKPEAAYSLLLHEAIAQHNVQLAAKLQQFGEDTFPDFKNLLGMH
jgi:hypothetical protein